MLKSESSHVFQSSLESTGVVVGVPSGDTVVVQTSSAETLTLFLDQIFSPRVAMKSQTTDTPEEPYGSTAREYLRLLAMGETVAFSARSVGQRSYGWVRLISGPHKGILLQQAILCEGCAKLKNLGTTKRVDMQEVMELLTVAESEARLAQRGVWSPTVTSRHITYTMGDPALVELWTKDLQGKEQDGVVEYVPNGGCVRIFCKDRRAVIQMYIAGIQADQVGRNGVAEEPFAAETKRLLEDLTYHRNIRFTVLSCDNFGNFIGLLRTPAGDVACALLSRGLVRMSHNIKMIPDLRPMRAALNAAQEAQKNRWGSFTKRSEAALKTYSARAIEVVSGDVILCAEGPTVRRLYLASVRAPRIGNESRPSEPFAEEAKAFCIEELIGKGDVTVRLEYAQDPFIGLSGMAAPVSDEASGQMHYVSIIYTKLGRSYIVNEELLKRGLATVNNRRDEKERAVNFDVLQDMENDASHKKLGVHGAAPLPKKAPVNLTGPQNTKSAKQWEEYMKRCGTMKGFVEYIYNAGRFRVLIPKENVSIAFVLAGVRSQAGPRLNQRRPEPLFEETLLFAKSMYMQRPVEVIVEACDKGGNFIGIMHMGGECVNVQVVYEGMARCSGLGRTTIKNQLDNAEASAKAQQLGIWGCKEIFDELEKEPVIKREANKDIGLVVVTQVNAWDEFYVQRESHERVILDMQKALQTLSPPCPADLFDTPPPKGTHVVARFSQDNQCYRARVVRSNAQSKTVEVFYIDYGNDELLTLDKVRRLPANLDVTRIPPVAELACVTGVSAAENFEDDAASLFYELTKDVGCCHSRNADND